MANKLIELRQRFRGYTPVNTHEESDDSEEEVMLSRSPSNDLLRRPAGGYRDPSAVERIPVKKSYFCTYIVLWGSISGIVFLGTVAHMLENDYLYLQTSGRKTTLSGGVVGAIYMYVLTASVCLYQLISRPQIRDTGRIAD